MTAETAEVPTGPIISGSIDLAIHDVDDHHSLMEHFRNAVVAQWGINEEEYWGMVQESLMQCPNQFLWAAYGGSEPMANNGPVGMSGDIFRGNAQPIGMTVATDLSAMAIELGIDKNPLASHFTLTVNPFQVDMARKLVKYVNQCRADFRIDVDTNASYAKNAWLLTPL